MVGTIIMVRYNVVLSATKGQRVDFDITILGGGVIGVALARALSTHYSVLLLEQHDQLGTETSSRNSEVIHAGLYYPSGSLKEQLCLDGKQRLYAFCEQYDIPFQAIGKLIVAQANQQNELDALIRKANQLAIPIEQLNRQQLRAIEPNVCAEYALYSPTTGIIDSHTYLQRLAQHATEQGALLQCHSPFISAEFDQYWRITTEQNQQPFTITSRYCINATGLHAQTTARQCGLNPQLIPTRYLCKGHYFSYQGRSPFKHLIYPMPEANLAGLGIHATLDLAGQVRFGPDTLYLDENELNYHVDEQRRALFADAIQRYFPQCDAQRLQPEYAGIRPKLHSADQPSRDFTLTPHWHQQQLAGLHLFGIESPGLTASLALANYVTEWLQSHDRPQPSMGTTP